jgi:hypothetical protein
MYHFDPRYSGVAKYTFQHRFLDGLVCREPLGMKLLWRRSRKNCDNVTISHVISKKSRHSLHVPKPLLLRFPLLYAGWILLLHHQWPHGCCQSLHFILICPMLGPLSWYATPHHLTSWLEKVGPGIVRGSDVLLPRSSVQDSSIEKAAVG